jgi:hypothetical protein
VLKSNAALKHLTRFAAFHPRRGFTNALVASLAGDALLSQRLDMCRAPIRLDADSYFPYRG